MVVFYVFMFKFSKTNLKQGAHIHQPTAWPVPHACAQPYHPGSGSHGQLFRPYWGSSAWHSRRVNERGKSRCIKDPLLAGISFRVYQFSEIIRGRERSARVLTFILTFLAQVSQYNCCTLSSDWLSA